MKYLLVFIVLFSFYSAPSFAQRGKKNLEMKDKLIRIYFNTYTDSIKPVMNYYLNVEGEYENGSYLPLDTNTVSITASAGTMAGNAWVMDAVAKHCEQVTFKVFVKGNPELKDSITLYLRKGISEEDRIIMDQKKGDGR